jgi:hypothetical protein
MNMRPSTYLALVLAIQIASSATSTGATEPSGTEDSAPLLEEMQKLTDLAKLSLDERGASWRCTPTRLDGCGESSCESKAVTPADDAVYVLLDFSTKRYSRCDSKGCDEYSLDVSVGGIFTTIDLPGRSGTFLKALNDGSQYIEVVTASLAVIRYSGACRKAIK